jgi:type I restriction enzyme, S subunit
MIADLKPYSAYKDSGVPWLKELPAHWEVHRQRNVIRMLVSNIDKHTVEGELPVRLCNYVDVYKNERITAVIPFMRASASVEEVERFRLLAGDVIITKDSESWTDIGVPALVEYSADDLVCGYHLAILRPREAMIKGRYLLRALQSQGVAAQYHVAANGVTRYGLSHDAIKNILLPLPPLPEQSTIVRYLDYIDRRIRRCISNKRRLIALLNEQKQAIIHRAVTRGLDPNARMKRSGVEWFRDVPEHWDIVRIKHVARMESGHTPSRSDPLHWLDDNDIPWVSLNDTRQLDRVDYISDTALHINALGLQNSSARLLPAGVVVFTRDAAVGKAAITTRPMAVSQHLIAWVCGPRILNRYLLRVFYAMKGELSRFTFGATIATIGMDDVRKLVTPVPPLDEQLTIATYLEHRCGIIDKTMETVKQELKAINDYRIRLIADVITGKVDVRKVGDQLPDEPGELKASADAVAAAVGEETMQDEEVVAADVESASDD